MHLKCLEQKRAWYIIQKKITTIIVVVYRVYTSFLCIFQYESRACYLKSMWKMGQSVKNI